VRLLERCDCQRCVNKRHTHVRETLSFSKLFSFTLHTVMYLVSPLTGIFKINWGHNKIFFDIELHFYSSYVMEHIAPRCLAWISIYISQYFRTDSPIQGHWFSTLSFSVQGFSIPVVCYFGEADYSLLLVVISFVCPYSIDLRVLCSESDIVYRPSDLRLSAKLVPNLQIESVAWSRKGFPRPLISIL
jgi:hypothetical protein